MAFVHIDNTVIRGAESKSRRLPGQGLSDRALAWLFVGPTILLLLAFNIFPLIWTIWLSFTNFRANRPGADVLWVGISNYSRVLNDESIWENMRATAHFLTCSITLQLLLGFGLALMLNRRFRTHSFWSTAILLPMMLAPAVVGTFWKYFFEPQYGIFNYIVNFFRAPLGLAGSFTMLGDTTLSPWAIVLVDTWMWTPYVMLLLLAGLRSIPPYLYEAAEIDRASEWTKFWRITLPMVMPFIVLAVLFRVIENFKMFDLVDQLTNGGPGSVTELASIKLKREAFEKWRTGYSSALAIILFVSIYGLSLVTVRFLDRVKQR
ncbi:sugar ABC transporter permease [Variovorax sp. J22P240]|uniref:carbohydrate ABC transporter permease n=1 Tax=Variovorax sp. J22P240 TaxID=3053514 RepID=UPI002575753B|nr:sugar ABC transporter permease [Variovorax sp. J22P240]MDL9999752.1 sugar ABC transporter permease [Variovorax sp. J22P240]